jgi:hypothetical protein
MVKTNLFDLFRYPRSLTVSWLGNAGARTGVYGIPLWGALASRGLAPRHAAGGIEGDDPADKASPRRWIVPTTGCPDPIEGIRFPD